MKILVVTPYFFERHRWMISAYKTARELSKDHDVVVLTTGKPRYEQIHPRLRIYRMFDVFLPDPVNYNIVPNLAFRLWRVVRKERPDMFIVNKFMFFTSFVVPLLRLMGKKVIMVTDTFPGYNWLPRSPLVALIMRLYFFLIGLPLLWMSNIVVLLHEGLQPVAQKLHLRARVMHNGIQRERYDNEYPDPSIPHDAQHINIGYVGRLESVKGYEDLVAVAAKMTSADSRLHFYFVGNNDGKQDYVRQHSSGQVHFLGHKENLGPLYKAFDMYVLPSYSEGLPNALMEAMYCGVPAIASAVGGADVLLKESGGGLQFQPGNLQEMQQRIQCLVDDPVLRQNLGTAAKSFIERGFTWDTIRRQYDELFSELTT